MTSQRKTSTCKWCLCLVFTLAFTSTPEALAYEDAWVEDYGHHRYSAEASSAEPMPAAVQVAEQPNAPPPPSAKDKYLKAANEAQRTKTSTPNEAGNTVDAAVRKCETEVDAFCVSTSVLKVYCKEGDSECQSQANPLCDVKELKNFVVKKWEKKPDGETLAAKMTRVFGLQNQANLIACIAYERDPTCTGGTGRKAEHWQDAWTTTFLGAAANSAPPKHPSPCKTGLELEEIDTSGPASVEAKATYTKAAKEAQQIKTSAPNEVGNTVDAAVKTCETEVDKFCIGTTMPLFCKKHENAEKNAECRTAATPLCDVKLKNFDVKKYEKKPADETPAALMTRVFGLQNQANLIACIAVERDPECTKSGRKDVHWQDEWQTTFLGACLPASAPPATEGSTCSSKEELLELEEDEAEEDEDEEDEAEEDFEEYEDEDDEVEEEEEENVAE